MIVRLAALLVFLQVLDVASTMVGLAYGAEERNPVGVWVLAGGPWGLLAAKLAATGAILGVVWLMARAPRGRAWAGTALLWCCVIMAGVVAWNGSVIAFRLLA